MPRNPLDWTTQRLNVTMARAEVKLMAEIASEQVSHPVAEYTPERIDRLLMQIEQAKKWTSPRELTFNF